MVPNFQLIAIESKDRCWVHQPGLTLSHKLHHGAQVTMRGHRWGCQLQKPSPIWKQVSPIFSAKKILGKVLIWKTRLALFFRPSQIIRCELYSLKFGHMQERLYSVRNVVSLASVIWSRHATRFLSPRRDWKTAATFWDFLFKKQEEYSSA